MGMKEDKTIYLSLAIALTGLIILNFMPSSTYEEKTLEQINEKCEGKIDTEGVISNTFFSKKDNYIGVMSEKDLEILVMLPKGEVFQGDKVKIEGEASRYREQCFIFPDKTKVTS
ncbi:MAG: hypothetical protein ACOCTT_00270 [archaeon]